MLDESQPAPAHPVASEPRGASGGTGATNGQEPSSAGATGGDDEASTSASGGTALAGAADTGGAGEASAGGEAAGGAAPIADPAAWTKVSLGIPPGFISALAVDFQHPGTLYAANFAGGGIYKTTNAGQKWQAVNHGLSNGEVRALAVDPKRSEKLFAATTHGLFGSTDGAASWQAVDYGNDKKPLVTVIAIDPHDSNVIYAAASGYFSPYVPASELFKSMDGGQHWSSLGTPSGSVALLLDIDELDSTHLYLATYTQGILESSNAGKSWTRLPTVPDVSVQTMTYEPKKKLLCGVAQGRATYSDDNGATWHPNWGGAMSISVAPDGAFYLAGTVGIARSEDCKNWASIDSHGAYTAVEDAEGRVFSGNVDYEGGGVRSSATEPPWSPLSEGIDNTDVPAIALDPARPGHVYVAAGQRGVYKSTDGAQSWQAANGQGPGMLGLGYDGAAVDTLAVNDGVVLGALWGTVFRSPDGGASWTYKNLPSVPPSDYMPQVTSLLFDPTTPSRVYVAAGAMASYPTYGFFTSMDGGETFDANAGPNLALSSLVLDAQHAGRFWAVGAPLGVKERSLYVSNDDGKGWAPVALPVPGDCSKVALAASPADGSVLYVTVENGGVLRSRDGGQSFVWQSKPSSGYYSALLVDPSDENTVYVAGSARVEPQQSRTGIFVSHDGGASFEPAGRGMLPLTEIESLVIDPQSPRTLYAGLRWGGIYKTTSGGE